MLCKRDVREFRFKFRFCVEPFRCLERRNISQFKQETVELSIDSCWSDVNPDHFLEIHKLWQYSKVRAIYQKELSGLISR